MGLYLYAHKYLANVSNFFIFRLLFWEGNHHRNLCQKIRNIQQLIFDKNILLLILYHKPSWSKRLKENSLLLLIPEPWGILLFSACLFETTGMRACLNTSIHSWILFTYLKRKKHSIVVKSVNFKKRYIWSKYSQCLQFSACVIPDKQMKARCDYFKLVWWKTRLQVACPIDAEDFWQWNLLQEKKKIFSVIINILGSVLISILGQESVHI